ncbi:acyl carrier protein [Pseudorhodobacter aquimaris]|uniref:acyl carrier protein n=1 Tax=Pseudorhodobacter aquimaris TaxID=687412 RepID=UPI00067ADC89|nr:acyl carrier protein [Pseudorhodobacter aquimaris]
MREIISNIFKGIWVEQTQSEPPVLTNDTVLLDTGLDSLGFAIVVTRLEEELGYDPFSISEDAYYPQTFGEFVEFYELHRPKA